MRKFLKLILFICIIALVCVLSFGGKYYISENEEVNTIANNEQKDKKLQNNTESKNNTTVIQKDNNEENVENTVEDETIKDKEDKENEKDKIEENTNEETNINDEDKAIQLAKKQYGNTEGVYFRIEQIQSNNTYIISVRDSETTKDLAWYTVNTKNGTVK